MNAFRYETSNLKAQPLWGGNRELDIAAEYRSCIGYAKTPGWTFMREYLRGVLGTFQGLRSVELGSGHGKVSVLFSLLGADVTLIDYNAKQLADALNLHGYFRTSAHAIRQNILDLPKELHERFDVAMSFGTAEHFWGGERQAVFDSHALVLRRGGLAIIWVPNRYGILYHVGRTVRKVLGRIPNIIDETAFDRKELRRRVASAGLVEPRIIGGTTFLEDFQQFIFNFSRLFRQKERWPFSGDAEKNIKVVCRCAQESRARITVWGNRFSYALVLVARRP